MRDEVDRSIVMQSLLAVGASVALLWLASLLPPICPAMMGGPPCGPEQRQSAALAGTMAVVAVGAAAFAGAMLAPRHRRQWVFGWGAVVLGATVLVGIGWVIASAGFIII